MKFNWEKLLSTKTETDRSTFRENDNRSPFDSDYSRITFSSPFRRLQDKTQVFPLEQNDFVRTRLTHSIEVASIARSLGKSISKKMVNNDDYGWKDEFGQDICVILECAGLVHDIGNPPFGHSSEKAIQKWFKDRINIIQSQFITDSKLSIDECSRIQDFLNFDGNVQGFRILTHLQCIYDYYGYHLTSALLATSMKYPFDSVRGNKKCDDNKYKKFGYFDAEKDSAEFVLNNCGLRDNNGEHFRHPLTFLLEAADDIAYSAADIEDGYKKGLFSFDDLVRVLNEKKNDECIKNVLSAFNKKGAVISLEERKIQWLRICIHQVYCDTVVKEFLDNYNAIMQGGFKGELLKSGKLKELRELLECFSLKYLIRNQEVSKIEIAGKNVISFLLDLFSEDLIENSIKTIDGKEISFSDCFNKLEASKSWNLISEDFKDIFKSIIISKSSDGLVIKNDVIYYCYLLITDFISCMTDSYCIRLYRRLMGIDIN